MSSTATDSITMTLVATLVCGFYLGWLTSDLLHSLVRRRG